MLLKNISNYKKIFIFFLLISFLFEFIRSFFQAIYGIYYIDRGLSISDVSSIKIFQIIAWLIFEIPCGIFADKFGRIKTFLFIIH